MSHLGYGATVVWLTGALLACGPAEHGSEPGETESHLRFAEVTSAAEPPPPPLRVCEPGTFRSCMHYYTESDGTHHCTPSIQFCRSNGTGWQRCAQPYVDAGPPPPEPEPEPEPAQPTRVK